MQFKPSPIQVEMLTALNSSYHFESLPQPRPSPKEDAPTPVIRCSIVDIKHKTPYASGTGVTEEMAFIDAIGNAHSADKPQTAAEIAAERDKLKEELAKMKRANADPKPPTDRRKIVKPGDRRLKANRIPTMLATDPASAVP